MPDSSVTIKLDRRISDALSYYTPSELDGRSNASARVRYALLSFLHERGSCTDLPRIATETRRGPRPTTARRRRRR